MELRVGRYNIRSQISDALALAASGRVDPGRAASRCDTPTLAAIAIRFRARRRPEVAQEHADACEAATQPKIFCKLHGRTGAYWG